MAPTKSSRGGHDEARPESATSKEKNSQSSDNHSSIKLRRIGSLTGSNLRDVTNSASLPSAVSAIAPPQPPIIPTLQWSSFDRTFLHAYRRAHHLNTPTAFATDYKGWILSQPGSIGLRSPIMAKRREFRRQTKDSLGGIVRKHFNGVGVQENDTIVDFIHKVRSERVTKPRKSRGNDNKSMEL